MTPLVLILGAQGCSATAVPLGSVTEAVAFPDAERFALTAQSVQSLLGTAEVEGPSGREVVWVVPVTDVRTELPSPVNVWVTPTLPFPAGTDPEVWLTRLGDRFDDVASTRQVTARVENDPGPATASIVRAVRDAEARHGLRSAPNAPVLACCD